MQPIRVSRFQFSLRDAFLLTLVAGFAIGWWMERRSARLYKAKAASWEGRAWALRNTLEANIPRWKVTFQDDGIHFDVEPPAPE